MLLDLCERCREANRAVFGSVIYVSRLYPESSKEGRIVATKRRFPKLSNREIADMLKTSVDYVSRILRRANGKT